MTDSERRERILAALERELAQPIEPEQARAYLIKQGVFTKKGKLRATLRAAAKQVAAA